MEILEIQTNTDLSHFTKAFKFYSVSSCCVIAIIIPLVWFGLDNFYDIVRTSAIALIEDNMYLLLTLLCLILAMIATNVIGVAFILRGIIKMEYVKVRNIFN